MIITKGLVISAVLGFLWGYLIPKISRRFAKFMPADPATAVSMIFHFSKTPKPKSQIHQKKYKALKKELFISSILSAILISGLFSITYMKMYSFAGAPLFLSFVAIITLLASIDLRYHVLPDILTVPLMLIGFYCAFKVGHIGIGNSIYGALFGYFIPLIAGVIISFRHKRAMGGGDFKMLAGLGAWLGVIKLNLAIVISAIVFIVFSLFWKKSIGPYGQALAVGGLITLLIGNDILMIIM